MTPRALLITSLFTAGCIGAFAGIVRYADALESNKPHTMHLILTYSEEAPTLDNCQNRVSRWLHDFPTVPKGWTTEFDCLPVKERE